MSCRRSRECDDKFLLICTVIISISFVVDTIYFMLPIGFHKIIDQKEYQIKNMRPASPLIVYALFQNEITGLTFMTGRLLRIGR